MKRFLVVLVAVVFFASCGNETAKKEEVKVKDAVEATVHIVKVSPDDFAEKAADLVGESIEIVGTVDHTCKHGGKKMVIYGENADNMVKLLAGEGIDKFDSELEGQKVIALGKVEEMRIDEEYLQNWEKEAKEHHGDNEEEYKGDLEQIANYRATFVKDSVDHVSFYNILCNSYKVVDKK